MPDQLGDRSASGRLRRVEEDGTVIYVAEPGTSPPLEKEFVPGDEIYADWGKTLGKAASKAWEKGKWLVPIVVDKVLDKVFSDDPKPQETEDPAKKEDQKSGQTHHSCDSGTQVDASKVKPAPAPAPEPAPAPAPEPAPAPAPAPEPAPAPAPAPAPSETGTGEGTTESGTDPANVEGANFAQPDGQDTYVSPAGAKLDKIWDDMKTMTFNDAESQAAYFADKVKEAGIEVKVTGRGWEAVDVLPDPGHVAAQLREKGIKDRRVIKEAVEEANAALAMVETFLKNLQADFLKDGRTVDEVEREEERAADPFTPADSYSRLIPAWIGLIPSGFSWQAAGMVDPAPLSSRTRPASSGVGTVSQPEGDDESGDLLNSVMGLVPRDLLEIETETSTGVVVRTRLYTSISREAGGILPPGRYTRPLPSFFANAPNAWEREA